VSQTTLAMRALDRAYLVVAHPDDEILWFGSIGSLVDRIIVCFLHDPAQPDLSEARIRALEQHPWADRIHCLALTETTAFGRADWPYPKLSRSGLVIRGPRPVARVYRECAEDLEEALAPQLVGAGNIFTHNPWGEYGHEEHVMVHRVASALARDVGAAIWYNNYVSAWSEALSRRYLFDPAGAMFERDVDTAAMRSIADIYRANGAWTWFDDYTWFANEVMLGGRTPMPMEPRFGRTFPVNFLNLEDRVPEKRKTGILRPLRRLLRGIGQRGIPND